MKKHVSNSLLFWVGLVLSVGTAIPEPNGEWAILLAAIGTLGNILLLVGGISWLVGKISKNKK